MKSLKASMRENKRYLLIKGKDLKKNIEEAVHDFIGVLGMSKASLAFIKCDSDWAIVSVNRESLNHIRAAFAVSNFENKGKEGFRNAGEFEVMRENITYTAIDDYIIDLGPIDWDEARRLYESVNEKIKQSELEKETNGNI